MTPLEDRAWERHPREGFYKRDSERSKVWEGLGRDEMMMVMGEVPEG